MRREHPELWADENMRQHFETKAFTGYDFDETMLRIGAMNMMLHGIEQPRNDALAGLTLSANQIAFVELIVEQLTASGRLDPALLYEPPFTDRNPNGVSDLFPDDQVR